MGSSPDRRGRNRKGRLRIPGALIRRPGETFRQTERVTLMREVLITREGLAKLEAEVERLATVERAAVTQRLKHAVESDGDLAGNGDYLDAKDEQALVEQRIVLLSERLACARVIDAPTNNNGVVTLGTRVRLRELGTDETVEYQIVGSIEGDPSELRISNESPVGRTVLGRTKGEEIVVEVPSGTLRFEILDVAAA
jgi:transcription elongation factor GreA